MLDLIRRKPIIMPDFIKSIEIPKRERAINDSFDRLPKLEKMDNVKHFYVRLSDLDLNQHVNSVNYVEWAVETIPLEIWQKQRVSDLEISFRAETNYGDRIISQTQHIEASEKNIFLHRLLRESDQREVATLRTKWAEDL
jgi:acyl-ACP thioesterase